MKKAEKRARDKGAEVVILSLHWGLEHYNEPSVPQLDMTRRITEETGVDLVIGHHSHVQHRCVYLLTPSSRFPFLIT